METSKLDLMSTRKILGIHITHRNIVLYTDKGDLQINDISNLQKLIAPVFEMGFCCIELEEVQNG